MKPDSCGLYVALCLLLHVGSTGAQTYTVTKLLYGEPEREMTSAGGGLNTIPQAANLTLTYYGSLPQNKFIAINEMNVPSSVPGNPCSADAANRPADSTHSGVLYAENLKSIMLLQHVLMLSRKIFAVCYAEVDGGSFDTTWVDSGIRVTFSEITAVSSHLVSHLTYGSIAKVDGLQLTYSGTHVAGGWLSLVASSLNGGSPCADASFPETVRAECWPPTDPSCSTSQYSGPALAPAGTRTAVFNTLSLLDDHYLSFAVCYKNSTESSWRDSSIRLYISKLVSLRYGSDSTSFEQRRFRAHNLMPATNVLPQVSLAWLRPSL